MQTAERPAPKRIAPHLRIAERGTGGEDSTREINQARQVLPSHTEIKHRNRIAGHDEAERGRVAHQVLDERGVRRESPRHALPRGDIRGHKGRMPRRPLARFEQEIGVALLRAQQRLASRTRVQCDV